MIPEPVPASNAPEWTVSELAGALKRTLEDRFGHVRIRGELGKITRHSSGHVYLDIKDEGACIAGVMWRHAAGRLKIRLEQGMEVVATGKITTFPGQSKYQINIETIEPAGVGALMALLDERRRRLEAEGLFAAGRKRRVPFLPTVIGVVTSPTGAVIRDILHRLADRFPRRVLLWPVRVQGEACAAEVAAAIAGLNALSHPMPRPDVIIVARGGGSLEDLWGFNDEAVVRAAIASRVPIISAIGHETDWTLLDHAADLRAPTPTGAAEMAVPVWSDLVAQLGGAGQRLAQGLVRGLDARRVELRSAARALPTPDALLGGRRQRLDLAGARLAPALLANARDHDVRLRHAAESLGRHTPRLELATARTRLDAVGTKPADALRRALTERQRRLDDLAGRLRVGRDAAMRAERLRLDRCRERIDTLAERARGASAREVERRRARIAALGQLLGSLGYRSVLERGYALVRTEDGLPIGRAHAIRSGQELEIEFADGRRRVQAEGARPEGARPEGARPEGARAPRRLSPLVQQTLFDM